MPVEKLLTSVNELSDINALMDALEQGRAIRQVMIP
jgi:Zn-dependent alcohol dehydrogenase